MGQIAATLGNRTQSILPNDTKKISEQVLRIETMHCAIIEVKSIKPAILVRAYIPLISFPQSLKKRLEEE